MNIEESVKQIENKLKEWSKSKERLIVNYWTPSVQ